MVVTAQSDGAARERLLDGVLVRAVPVWKLLGGLYPLPKPGPALVRACIQVLRFSPAVVITRTRIYVLCLIGTVLARLTGARLIYSEGGSGYAVTGNRWAAALSRAYDDTAGRLVVHSAAVAVGISEAAAQHCQRFGARRTMVIPNGVEMHPLTSRATAAMREELAPAQGVLYCFLGRLAPVKGVDNLIKAFASAKAKVPGSRLLIVGDGPRKKELHVLARELALDGDIIFRGEAEHETAMLLLAAADVFVNPSYAEGGPTTVLEAAVLGKAIVATDVGGTPEIITDGVSGILVPAGDVAALAQAMIAAATDPGLRGRLGAAAQVEARRYDPDTAYDAWERLLLGKRQCKRTNEGEAHGES